jgi:hypothetical protein
MGSGLPLTFGKGITLHIYSFKQVSVWSISLYLQRFDIPGIFDMPVMDPSLGAYTWFLRPTAKHRG